MADEKMIKPVKNNVEKQAAYRVQLGRYRKALNNEFYFEALLIVYAMLEDRMRSFLYYIGAIRQSDSKKLNVHKTKSILRMLYFGSEDAAAGRKMNLENISVKEGLIRNTITWAVNYEGTPDEKYLALLKSEYEGCVDMGGMLTVLDEIDAWRNYRNEIIHGLLNKDINSVDDNLRAKVEEGMSYARFIDSQVKALKANNRIRKGMRIID